MGAVFLGREPAGRLVAVKIIKAEYARDEGFRARFRSEVNRAREVPAFCTAEVLDADPDHRTPYLVIEYVDGPSLAELVREQGPLRGGSLHSIAVGVATALTAIHSTGVVHRDLKPGNVLLAAGSPKVIDFGIAKALEATTHHTRTQDTVGTVSYMAPERLAADANRTLTPAADIFAWGAVIAFAATGRTPFAADSPAATAGRILTQPPQLDGVPAELAGIIGRALAKDPEQRPTAQELLFELVSGTGTTAAVAAKVRPRRRRRPAVAAAAAAVVLLTVAGVWAGARLGAEGQDQPAAAVAPRASSSAAAPDPALARQSKKELFDPLTSSSLWAPSGPAEEGCDFDGGLVVRTEFMIDCANGPDQIFAGDLKIRVEAQLSLRSCAIVYFRLSEDGSNGYFAEFCAREVAVAFLNGFLEDTDNRSVVDGTMKPLDIEEDGSHLLGVDVVKSTAKLSVDGKTVLTSDLSRGKPAGARHTKGKVTFGASGGGGPAIKVTFRDARITVK
ncbi:putative serine/threonine protein kinase [Actinoplanes friuliensis DSM 7358]|uniref:Putative serine/threonine protein kinase n=2 Tax=Actinoplanes friuliensis TaxID=196914 RepID=U5W7Y3_9ACTN|nr:putative serine/threonine protein kinase [Actinoplanes friuliensis DSM 7358]